VQAQEGNQAGKREEDELESVIASLAEELQIDFDASAKVVVGRDTRATGTRFALAVMDGVGVVLPALARSIGIVTTPQLHYVVSCENGGDSLASSATLQGYNDRFVGAFIALVEGAPAGKNYSPDLTVDVQMEWGPGR